MTDNYLAISYNGSNQQSAEDIDDPTDDLNKFILKLRKQTLVNFIKK